MSHIWGDWFPRPDQDSLINYLASGGLRAVEVAHRRWGKDEVALRWTALSMGMRVGNYWHMLPEYSQARKVIWTAVNPRTGVKRIDESFPPNARVKTHEQEMLIELDNGSTWQLVGSDNYDSLVGSPPVGIVFSEWAIANPLAWAYLAPILEENGGWALFIYTPRGNNHGRTMLKTAIATAGWFGEVLGADKTPVFTTGQLDGIKQSLVDIFGSEQGETLFLQEYFCSFEGAVYGAYYAKQLNQARSGGRIGNVPHVPNFEVYTAWDLGVDDSTSIWFFQIVGKEFRFIDYYENSGYGMAHYAGVLKEKPYVYGDHYMPHDADQRMQGASEIAQSKKEIAEQLGIKPVVVIARARNIDAILLGIEAGRNVLAQCWFDEGRCSHGLSALEGYRADYDEEKKKLANRPLHDWCFSSETYLLTKYGKCQMVNLPNSGEVLTLCGWKAYQNPRVTRKDAQLVEVVFADGYTVRCTPDHMFLTVKGWKSAESLTKGTVIQSSLTHLPNILGLNGRDKKKSVPYVLRPLWLLFAKAVFPKSIAQHIVSPSVVTSVNSLDKREDVWCLTVPDINHFSLSNGAIVHNCSHGADAFRTFAVGYRPPEERMTVSDFMNSIDLSGRW